MVRKLLGVFAAATAVFALVTFCGHFFSDNITAPSQSNTPVELLDLGRLNVNTHTRTDTHINLTGDDANLVFRHHIFGANHYDTRPGNSAMSRNHGNSEGQSILTGRFYSKKANVKAGFLLEIFYTDEEKLPDDMPNTLLAQAVVSSIEFTSASSFKSHVQTLPKAFIATFDGEFEVKTIGTYTFCGTSGAGGRLYMDGQLLAETGGGGKACGELNVIPGRHVVRFEALARDSPKAVVTYQGPDTGGSPSQIKSLSSASFRDRIPRGFQASRRPHARARAHTDTY